jgi:glycosyltransferase involved in cell wall biosynthesis
MEQKRREVRLMANQSLKVLQIHSSDYTGGGGGTVAMERLHGGLREVGVDSRILAGKKTRESSYSTAIPKSGKWGFLEARLKKVTTELGLNDLHHLNSFQVKQTKAYLEADLLHFHGTHGFFNYLALPGLTKTKPAVFTLHDMWPLTGHCAYSYDCERWKIGCGRCPHPDTHPAIKRDNTRLEWKLKDWVYRRSNLAIVTLSNWLTEIAKQSMLSRFPIYQIPNGIDTEVYQPLDFEKCRFVLGIPPGKKVLMFVALQLRDHRKGADLLLKGLQSLPESLKAEMVLLLLGAGGEAIAETVGIPTLNLGYVRDDRFKAIAYSAADLFVFPSRAETFGLVLAESMACGTPVVSFDVSGIPDLIRPGVTGYLAEAENVADFRDGIIKLLEDTTLRQILGQQGRAMVVNEYNLNLHVQRHIELYGQLLSKDVKQWVNNVTQLSAQLPVEMIEERLGLR